MSHELKRKRDLLQKERKTIEDINRPKKQPPPVQPTPKPYTPAAPKEQPRTSSNDAPKLASSTTTAEVDYVPTAIKRKKPTSLMDALEEMKAESSGQHYIPKEHSHFRVPKIPRMAGASDSPATSQKSCTNAVSNGIPMKSQTDYKKNSVSPKLAKPGSIKTPNSTAKINRPTSSQYPPHKKPNGITNVHSHKTQPSASSTMRKQNPAVHKQHVKSLPSNRPTSSHMGHTSVNNSQKKLPPSTTTHSARMATTKPPVGSSSSKSGLSRPNNVPQRAPLVTKRPSSQPPSNSSRPVARPSGIAAQFGIGGVSSRPAPPPRPQSAQKAPQPRISQASINFSGKNGTTSTAPLKGKPSNHPVKPQQQPPSKTGIAAQQAKQKIKPSGIAAQQRPKAPVGRGIAAQQSALIARGIAAQQSAPVARGIAAQQGMPMARGIAAQFGAAPYRGRSPGTYSCEESDDYESDDSFIDDSEATSAKEYNKYVKDIHQSLHFDPKKYATVSRFDDLNTMESSYRQIEKEEKVR